MKEYLSIPGWKNSVLGLPCLAFNKLDGSNMRMEWSKKNGFYKYGTRHCLLDRSHSEFGEVIPLFENTLLDKLNKFFLETYPKKFHKIEGATVFCEFWGENSFAGLHDKNDKKNLTIIDIAIHKKGIILPRDFIKLLDGFPIPDVVYEGNFNKELILNIRENGKGEGIVAKGINPNAKKEQHSLWMTKVKTNEWINKLRGLALNNSQLESVLKDNVREQELLETSNV